MLMKFYNGLGISTCVLLGIAFAAGWRAPDLGSSSTGGSSGTSSHYSSGRSWFHSSSGWSFGK